MTLLLPYFLDYKTEIESSSDPERKRSFYEKLSFDVLTCDEAAEVFPDMLKCPVCLEEATLHEDCLILLHKDLEEIVN